MVIALVSTFGVLASFAAAFVTTPSYDTPSPPSYNTPPPTYDEPAYNEPAYDEPSYKEPAYEEPTYLKPTYQESAYHKPTYKEPSYPEAYGGPSGVYGVYPDHPAPADLKTFVENHLAPHYDGLVCYGLNASFHMHIKTRMALGCSLASDSKPAATGKYSACEVLIMKKFLLCNENDHACYNAHLESMASCKDACCKRNPKYCHAAVCRGLERSSVDVQNALAYCKGVLFPLESPEACPFLSKLWINCRYFILAAEEVCSQKDGHGKLACTRAALILGGHAKCVACTHPDSIYS